MSHHRDQPQNDEDRCGQAQEEAREARFSLHLIFRLQCGPIATLGQ
jgi:hypothetical protein